MQMLLYKWPGFIWILLTLRGSYTFKHWIREIRKDEFVSEPYCVRI